MKINIPKKIRPWMVIYLGSIITIISFLPELLNWQYVLHGDWGYFNAFSLFTRSSVVNYKTILLYDPWNMGGFDQLTNPENRLFSPLIILTILLPPQLANIITLMLFALAGFVSCYYLLKHYRISFLVNLICATLFVNAQWFGLHVAEGQIPFGAFYLLPLIWLCIIRLDERKFAFLFTMLSAFFILNGSFYTFIFSIVMLICACLFGFCPVKKIFSMDNLRRNGLFYILLFLAFLMTSAMKLIPILTNVNKSQHERTYIHFHDLGEIFFNYLGTPYDVFRDTGYHEFGCFIGLLAVLIIVFYLFKKENLAKGRKFLYLALIFFWISTNWGHYFNPWTVLGFIPLLNIAHIQSRYLILMFFFLLILLAFALQKLKIKNKRCFYAAAFILVLESFFVRIYPSYFMSSMSASELEPLTHSLMTQRDLTTTINDAGGSDRKPFHYFTGTGARYTYEPIMLHTPSEIKSNEDGEAYRGEIYFADPQVSGTVQYREVIPGRITFDYQVYNPEILPAVIELNLNWAAGFKVSQSEGATTFPTGKYGLINVRVTQPAGTVTLTYAPWYLIPAISLYIAGCILWAIVFFLYRRDLMLSRTG